MESKTKVKVTIQAFIERSISWGVH